LRLVLDASAAVHVVLRTDRATGFIVALEDSAIVLAPSLFQSEVANTLWKYVRAGMLDKQTAMVHLEEALDLVDTLESDQTLVTEALSQSVLHDHPVYDLLYVVLAMRFGSRLISADHKLLKLAERIDPSMV